MATIKSFSDLEQSKKLSKILPIESADMFYMFESITGELRYHQIIITEQTNRNYIISEHNSGEGLVSWSLAALLSVLPSATLDSSNDHYYRLRCMEKYTEWYDNAIDACYEAILKLHELKKL